MMRSRLFRLVTTASLPLQRVVLRRRLGRLVCEEVQGIPLVVLPEVFNPAVFRSTDVFVRALRARVGPAGPAGGCALDMGTGTGVLAVAAAQLGYTVVAVDINPEAVRCARINALLNHAEQAIDVREGDLFEPVAGGQFDLVLFNPPFFAGEPTSDLDKAWRSPDVLERFGAGLPAVLAADGHALVSLSSHGGQERTTAALRGAGLVLSTAFVADLGNEVFTVVDARRPAGRP